MSVLWLYHYRVLASLKLQITEILLTFMKFFLRLLWILPARKRSFTKMSFVLRIVLVCKTTTTALIKTINIQKSKLNISTYNLKTSNLRFVYHWDARVNANANFYTLFHTHLRLHLRCYPCPFACTISYVYGPVFVHVCLIEVCLCFNLRWFVSGVSKRECFVYLIFILCLRQHMYVVCSTWRSRFLNNICEWPKSLSYPFLSNPFAFCFRPKPINFCSLCPLQGNLDSGIQETFAFGILNPGKLCLWNQEFWALESGIQLKIPESH